MDVINIKEKLGLFTETWTPKIIANVDNHMVYLAKLDGDFIWHKHDDTDEMFLVIDGVLNLEFRDKKVTLNPGEMIVVPKGVEHRPHTSEGASVMIFEDAGTDHTGGIESEFRKENHDRI
jgi:mannose-6-phosphate isomerase-like protein (cupin superfamily)